LIKTDEENSQNKIRGNLENSTKDIVIKTYDSQTFMFNQDTYRLIGDTLQGTGCQVIPDSNFYKNENQKSDFNYLTDDKMPLHIIKIDLRNIKEIESNKFNTARTIQGVIVSSVAIGFFVFAIAVVIEGSSMARL
jgi:hypothetical protein